MEQVLSAVVGWVDRFAGVPLTVIGILLAGVVAAGVLRVVVTWLVHVVLVGSGKVRRRARRTLARAARRGDSLVTQTAPMASARRLQRAHTIATLLRAASTTTVVAATVVGVLHVLQVDIGKLLTAAGVVGVVLGFGAQTLIRDVLAGLGMILEEQYAVGDVIEVGDVSGTVEDVRLRVTRIRADNGTQWFLRNGDVSRVGNRTKGWSRAVVDIPIRYDQDVDEAIAALLEAGRVVRATPPHSANIMDAPHVDGVEELTPDHLMLRLWVKTVPTRQWEVARALRVAARRELAHRGILLAGTDVVPDLTREGQAPVPAGSGEVGPAMPPPLVHRRHSVLPRRRTARPSPQDR